MDVDSAFLDEHVVAPDLVEQLRAREHAFWMRHEEMQQAEFRGADLQRLAVAGQAVCDRVQLQAAHVDDVVGELGRAAAARPDAGHQLLGREGLGDVVVGAGFQAVDLVLLGALGGEHDDRNGAGAFVVARLRATARPEVPGSIQSSRIRSGSSARIRVWAWSASKAQHLVSGEGQVDGDQFLDGGFVFDDENGAGHGGCLGTMRSAGAARIAIVWPQYFRYVTVAQ